MQDNTLMHKAAFYQIGVDELEWPAPDLKPIQHLWDKLKRWLQARPSHPTSVADHTNALVVECQQIPAATFQNFVESLPIGMEAVIAAYQYPWF